MNADPGPIPSDSPAAAAQVGTDDESFAARLRGFGPVGILAILAILLTGNVFVGEVVVPVGAALVLAWVVASRTPWRAIGYVRPRNWLVAIAVGVVSGIALKFAMKAVVMPLLGADPVNQAYHHLAGNRALLPAAIWAMLVAGFGEETVFRGFLFERLRALAGRGTATTVAIVLGTSVVFGLGHYAVQGIPGVQQATLFGLVFGTIYATTGRLFTLMCAHAAFDLTALAMIYFDLEREVAGLVFP